MTPRTDAGHAHDEPGLHMIGNAHMDPVWIWDWREGYGETWATFRSALDRIKENPGFRFTASSAAHHAWIEEHDPAMFEEIRAAVQQRRWVIVGGMWVEPDCNLPSGEALCRQLLLGQRYFERAFGRAATIGYNVDSFGHNAGLPRLLRQAGLKAYAFMRPAEHERDLPAPLFSWTDASGAALPAYRIPVDYRTETAEELSPLVETGRALSQQHHTAMMLFYGVGNHGGGPTRRILDRLGELSARYPSLRLSDPDTYFQETPDGALPVVAGELQHHAVGCYSVGAWIKAAHARAERTLLNAEQLDVVASRLTRKPRRTDRLREAWEHLALSEFHDIIAGTASARAYRFERDRFGHTTTIADQILSDSLFTIAHHIDTSASGLVERDSSFWLGSEGRGVPHLVYNPLSWPIRQVVVISRSADQVTDSQGTTLACQAVTSGEVTLFASHTAVGVELPPLGYEVLWLQGGRRRTVQTPTPSRGQPVMTNTHLTISVDPATGAITHLVDRRRGADVVASDGIHFTVIDDHSDTWSHDVAGYQGEAHPVEFKGWELLEDGPVRSVLRLRYRWHDSTLAQDLILGRDADFLEMRVHANWLTPNVVLKLVTPWSMPPNADTTAGAAYLYVEREAVGQEEPMQGWLDCYDPQAGCGVAITTDHLYGYDLWPDKATPRLTILRNPLTADHGGGWATTADEDFERSDNGPHQCSIRVYPHRGDWRALDLPKRSDEHRRPPLTVADTYHTGTLPPRGAFIDIDRAGGLHIGAIKAAEDGSGVVIRVVEQVGQTTSTHLAGTVLGREVDLTLAPYELQTLLIPDNPEQPVRPIPITELDPPADEEAS